MSARAAWFALWSCAALAAQEAPPWNLDRALLEAELEQLESRGPRGVRLGLWVGDPEGRAACARRADEAFPAASAIKTALVIEVFARRADELERIPRELVALCDDPAHPLWAPLAPRPSQGSVEIEGPRELARAALRELSLFALGDLALRGTAATNATYNAGGSALLALLGGPEAASQALRARSPRYAGLELRRWFLAPRTRGDNTATPRALGALLGDLARDAVPGMSREAASAARAVLLARRSLEHGALYQKDGALDTDPACRVRSGFAEDRFGAWVWVIAATADAGGDARGPELERAVAEAHEVVRERVRAARAGRAVAFERRSGFVSEGESAEAWPVRPAGALVGAARLPAVVGAREGEHVAVLGPARVEEILALAEDVGAEGRVQVHDPRSERLRLLALEASSRGLDQVISARDRDGLPEWNPPLATLAVHAPERSLKPAGRSSALDALLAALAPGGIAVLWLDGAAVPAGELAREAELRGWLEAARALGFERGRLWRFPQGAAFALELRRPAAGERRR
ncbi:MAG: hypothetical protein JNM84_26585 [Planctomycetes bacterium]|nr:hypothetical protein [Planctomycetota bacterium]